VSISWSLITASLPDQTEVEIEKAGRMLIEMGINQAATYPLFRFPYTKFGAESGYRKGSLITMLRRRRMLHILEDIFYASGFERTSVWAFTEKDVEKYCSVTVPQYIGLGASGSTYLKDLFYLNTFDVSCYLDAMQTRENAIALSMPLTEKMQMAGWLYWRIYETRFSKTLFKERFHRDFDHIYGKLIGTLSLLDFLEQDHVKVVLSDRGSYWIHAFEDLFSIDYISKLWGRSQLEGWPEVVVL
jgi:coproporphyrinogen III oxidase-like Fe-S oxidoreductase